MKCNTSIVIVTFNSEAVLPACLASLPKNVPLIIVDNASLDASTQLCRRLAPQAGIIECPLNQGFGPAANLGFAGITTEFGLLLNADVQVAPDMLATLLDAAQTYPDAGMLAPTAIEHGEPQFGRRVLFSPPWVAPVAAPTTTTGDFCAPYIGGPAMLFRMTAFRAIGGFDENLFLYYEDDDICLRLHAAGYPLVQVYAARLTHLAGESTIGINNLLYWKHWHMAWSRLYMERKYRRPGGVLAYTLREGGINLIKYLFRPTDPRRPRYRGRLAGLFRFLTGAKARDTRLGPPQS